MAHLLNLKLKNGMGYERELQRQGSNNKRYGKYIVGLPELSLSTLVAK
jgi:hypothetical protein